MLASHGSLHRHLPDQDGHESDLVTARALNGFSHWKTHRVVDDAVQASAGWPSRPDREGGRQPQREEAALRALPALAICARARERISPPRVFDEAGRARSGRPAPARSPLLLYDIALSLNRVTLLRIGSLAQSRTRLPQLATRNEMQCLSAGPLAAFDLSRTVPVLAALLRTLQPPERCCPHLSPIPSFPSSTTGTFGSVVSVPGER